MMGGKSTENALEIALGVSARDDSAGVRMLDEGSPKAPKIKLNNHLAPVADLAWHPSHLPSSNHAASCWHLLYTQAGGTTREG